MEKQINIIITGDCFPGGGRVVEPAIKGDAETLLGPFLSLIQNAELAITNLESPVINGGTPIEKTGPVLKSPVESLNGLTAAGFHLATLANNHIMDYGNEGLISTLEICRDAGIDTTGAGKNLVEAKKPWIFEKNGVTVTILNIAENEFGTTTGDRPGCHPMDLAENYYSIQEAKKSADHVIVIVHGGHEHYGLPSPRMKKSYRFYADAGASAVIAHHTHCTCGLEQYNGVPICYSLGNFLFDLPDRKGQEVTPWNQGYIAELIITGDTLEVRYHSYVQNTKDTAGLREMTPEERDQFAETEKMQARVIVDQNLLEKKFDEYCAGVEKMYNGFIEPHSNRILHALRNRKMIPSFLPDRKKRLLLNLARCEAHRDILIKTLSS